MDMSDVKFFWGNAGYSYRPPQTPTAGRLETARALALAEARRKREGAWVAWENDPEPFDDDVHGSDEYGYGALLYQYNEQADRPIILASLWGIDAEPGDDYRRVVEAELALEIWG